MKLSSHLPDAELNGLDQIVSALVNRPLDRHYVVAIVDCQKSVTDNDSGNIEPVMRILEIEPLTGTLAARAEELLTDAHAHRTGRLELPFVTGKEGN